MQDNMKYQQLLERCEALETENKNLRESNNSLITQVGELRKWLGELEEVRDWLKKQNDALVNREKELSEWIAELEKNRDWMAAHDVDQQKSIIELQNWATEVEKAKNEFIDLYQKALEDKMLAEAELERISDSLNGLESKLKSVPAALRRLIRL